MNPNWRVVIYHLVATLIRMISRCEILNNGVITRAGMTEVSFGSGVEMNPNWRVVIYHLVETLMRMISRCEILNNGVIIRKELLKRRISNGR